MQHTQNVTEAVDQTLCDRLGDPLFFLAEEFHPLLAQLRRASPVHWCQAWEDRGFWSVTRYHDIREILFKPELFSSQQVGSVIPADPHMYDNPEVRAAGGIGMIPTFSDPPRHDEVRRSVKEPFGPNILAWF